MKSNLYFLHNVIFISILSGITVQLGVPFYVMPIALMVLATIIDEEKW